MHDIDERLLELIGYREQIHRALELGTYTDREVADTLQAIEEEIGNLRQERADQIHRESLRRMTPEQAARELHKRQRNAEILERTRVYIKALKARPSEPLLIQDGPWTSNVLEGLTVSMHYLQAVRYAGKWYIAASPEALEELSRRFEKYRNDHNERGRELWRAIDTINDMRRGESR